MSEHPSDAGSTFTDTEFVVESFETVVDDESVRDLGETIAAAVRTLRSRVSSDDDVERILGGQPGRDVLTAADTDEREDPEPLTQRAVVEPLFEALGYPDLSVETGDLGDRRGQQADYAVSLRDVDGVDSDRLLVEAEPLNKRLDQESHGLGQAKDWLEKRQFAADFAIATDGMRWVLVRYDRDAYAVDTLAEVNLQPLFVAAFENQTGRQVSLADWLDSSSEAVLRNFLRAFGYENFVSVAGDARAAIKEKKAEITDEFYEKYVRLVFGITGDGEERAARSLIGDGVVRPDGATGDDVRLFAVELMNRLVFLKFLEDKGLVEPTLLAEFQEAHDGGLHVDSLYETYLEPLFFDVLDERPGERTERVRDITVYEDVPYLDGGLFRPTVENGGRFDETAFDVRDSVLDSIIDLLEEYTFSADGSPADLDPSVLGNVFEKTINHVTTDSGDTQKELGAYYTPDEITRFCAEQTVRPALLERFQEAIVEDWGWKRADVDYDDVYDLVDALPANRDLAELLLGVVDEFRALDPACGSGHFLTSVQGEIVSIRKALYEKHPEEPADWELHRQTVVQNVYGVDVVSPAVEIAKLRLWLSIIAEVDPSEVDEYDDEELALPNVVFNVRQGNSLIGFTDLMETAGDGEQAALTSWGADSVRAKYGDLIDLVEKHRETSDTREASEYLRRAEHLLDQYRGDLDEKVLAGFHDAGIEDATLDQVRSYDPFHWVLEFAIVYADGGFDAIVGNPPWDQLRPSRDDYFSRFDDRFRSRMPSAKDAKQAELLERKDVAEGWEEYQKGIETQMRYFTDGTAYELQKPTVDGRTDPNENNLAALFLERVFELVRDNGFVAQVLPGVIFNGSFSKDLRLKLLDDSEIRALVEFENHGIFEGIDIRYHFGVVVFDNDGRTDVLRGVFDQRDVEALEQFARRAVEIPRQVLTRYSQEARIFPFVTSQQEVEVLSKMLSHPPLGQHLDDAWNVVPHRELDRARASDRFVESPDEGEYPVYGGKNIHQFSYDNALDRGIEPPALWSVTEDHPERSAMYRVRERAFNSGELKRALYEAFGGPETDKSQKQFVNDLLSEYRNRELSIDDVRPDFTEYRIVYRDIARSTDERTMIATVLPKGIVCVHTLQTFSPFEIDPEKEDLREFPLHDAYSRAYGDRELFAITGLFNSLPFDFLMRTKIDTHVVRYKLEESQVPRLTDGDDWFHYVSDRAARLNCYGEAFAEMRERLGGVDPATDPGERERLQAEIDAAAFHAYGLDREETAFVLEDFHRVRDPRLMTEEYFALVLETYDDLADEGPLP